MADIVFETGYKDDYKFVVKLDEGCNEWAPRMPEIFKLISMWFEAEDHAYGDGYGARWPLWYVCLIGAGYEDKAMEAANLEGAEALTHFERTFMEHKDDVAEYLGVNLENGPPTGQ